MKPQYFYFIIGGIYLFFYLLFSAFKSEDVIWQLQSLIFIIGCFSSFTIGSIIEYLYKNKEVKL